MIGSVAYGGHTLILKSRVAVSVMVASWCVLNTLSRFWLVFELSVSKQGWLSCNSQLLKDSPSIFIHVILSGRKGHIEKY